MCAVRERWRPKHQVLILKCYPKYQKSNLEVKPNSSELSYLLYYASTRPSKLQKVGTFLEKKNSSDIWRNRMGNVQVTLHILTSLVEKCSRDLPLIALSILRTLYAVLQRKEISLVEDSVSVFETFCAHRDSATLSADQTYTKQYDEVVRTYIAFASKDAPVKTSKPISVPVAVRFRSAGLQAIKCMVSSETLLLESNQQLKHVIPVILQNLYSGRKYRLSVLQHREQAKEQFEKQSSLRRRQSISVTQNTDASEADPSTASGTTADVDEKADEEVGVLALKSLRLLFAANNRSQLRMSAAAVLDFVAERAKNQALSDEDGDWYTELLETISLWTPVQDRFTILIMAMELLIRSPLVEEDIPRQLILARIIGSLLRSKINFIGLSVMDVLLGLIHYTLLILRPRLKHADTFPHYQQSLALDTRVQSIASQKQTTLQGGMDISTSIPDQPSPAAQIRMLQELEACIGDLATHIYYSDQISDMVLALFLRLKPPPGSNLPAASTKTEGPVHSVVEDADSVPLHQEKSHVEGILSFDTARLLALRAIKRIISVANTRRGDDESAVVRNRVEVVVWEGTQWLLRDPNGQVRLAYVDALLAWLHLEMDKKDCRLIDENSRTHTAIRKDFDKSQDPKVARRAIVSATHKSKSKSTARAAFLQLLSLAIYEHSLEYTASEPDILLLHLLSSSLVKEFGINYVRFSLPVIFRLQDDAFLVAVPSERTTIICLIYGFFWAIVDAFDLETSSVGKEVEDEISQRTRDDPWLNKISVPPVTLEHLGSPADLSSLDRLTHQPVKPDLLKRFDARKAMVDAIIDSYTEMPLSPPSSPPASPGRRFSMPAVHSRNPSSLSVKAKRLFPEKIKEQMLLEWTKESCTAAIQAEKTSSLSGSKGGTGSGPRHFLSVNGVHGAGVGTRTPSPRPDHQAYRSHLPVASAFGLMGSGRGAMHDIFRQRSRGSSPGAVSRSSAHSVLRVKELKRALSGNYMNGLPPAEGSKDYPKDTESESLVNDNTSASEDSLSYAVDAEGRPTTATGESTTLRPGSRYSNHIPQASEPGDQDLPPLPTLPPALQIQVGTPLVDGFEKKLGEQTGGAGLRTQRSESQLGRASRSGSFNSWQRSIGGQRNVDELLSGIEPSRPTTRSGRVKPPY